MPFVVKDEKDVLVFEPSGFLTGHADSYEFLEAVRGKIAEGSKRIIVNLAGVDKVNSSGIGVLAAIISSATNAEAYVRFACIPDNVWKIMTIVGLGRLVKNHASVEEALADM
ncbi:MAG: STAS domain-containing protein [Candidatus Eisenbacteria bacterium]